MTIEELRQQIADLEDALDHANRFVDDAQEVLEDKMFERDQVSDELFNARNALNDAIAAEAGQ